MKEIVVDRNSNNQRIEKFVKNYFSDAPLSFIYKAFRKKDIKVNGHWVDKTYILKENDVVRVYISDQQLEDFAKPREATPRDLPYEIVYEDRNVLIINKPKGLLVYGDDKGSKETLSNAVLDYLCFKGEFNPSNPSFIPSPAHRLDRNTSGLVIFGKNESALHDLTELFKNRDKISKKYITLVVGNVSSDGEVNKPLKKDESTGKVTICPISKGGKNALTKYKVLKKFNHYTLLEIDLITGRTHQIRVHMASIGHPVVGDNKYGDFSDCKIVNQLFHLDSQFLHAYKMSFGTLEGCLKDLSKKSFEASLSKDLKQILDKID